MVIDKNRIVTGLVIITFFLIGYLFKLDLYILLSISTLIIYELYKSSFLTKSYNVYLTLILFMIIFPIIYYQNQIINFLNILVIFIVLIMILFPNFYFKKLFLLVVLIFIHNFFSIYYYDRNILYFIIFTAFFNDTIAYIAGNLIKGPLVIPRISPNKTWSGTIVSFICSFILIIQFNIYPIIAILLSISLFFGDIFFSYIKRKINLKDFSNFLKGHGGILDRLDSMFFFIIILNFNYL